MHFKSISQSKFCIGKINLSPLFKFAGAIWTNSAPFLLLRQLSCLRWCLQQQFQKAWPWNSRLYPFVTPPEQAQPIPSCVEIPFLKWSQTRPQFTSVEKAYFFFLDEKGGSARFMFTCLSTVAAQTEVSTYEVKPHMFLSEQRSFANLYFSRRVFQGKDSLYKYI